MKTLVLRALWGMTEGDTLEHKLQRIHEAGYDGVEAPQPDIAPARWRELLAQYDLVYVGMIFGNDIEMFKRQLTSILDYQPLLLNAHSGRDRWPFAEGCAYFRAALEAEANAGIAIAHETHRYRLLYCPWVTAAYLNEFPELKLTADFSHWCVVCETLLDDMDDYLRIAVQRAVHIHARVGHQEGPQVADPRAPEYQPHVEAHERWWDAIRQARLAASAPHLTATAEFGPPGYMPTLPYTQQPVANLWDVCLYMAGRLRQRWAE